MKEEEVLSEQASNQEIKLKNKKNLMIDRDGYVDVDDDYSFQVNYFTLFYFVDDRLSFIFFYYFYFISSIIQQQLYIND